MKQISFFQQRLLPLFLTLLILISNVSACGQGESFDDFTYSLFLDEVTSNTLNLHYTLENPNAYGIKTYPISLGSFSNNARNYSITSMEHTQDSLHHYPYLSLSIEEKLTYDILEDYLNTQLALSKYPLYQEPLSGSGGLQMELPILFAEYEFHSEQDVKDYLELFAITDDYYESLLLFEKEKYIPQAIQNIQKIDILSIALLM